MTEIEALGKVFAAEAENRLPFQSKAAIYKRLEAFGLVRPFQYTHGPVTAAGWSLTPAGHLHYCMNCDSSPPAPEQP